jgi:hypothetical protein
MGIILDPEGRCGIIRLAIPNHYSGNGVAGKSGSWSFIQVADVAQQAERPICNRQVASSILAVGSTLVLIARRLCRSWQHGHDGWRGSRQPQYRVQKKLIEYAWAGARVDKGG